MAGADDLGAIWYNPAGLADAGTTVFIDLAWLNFSSEYTRSTQVTDNGGTIRTYNYPKVDGTTPFLPIPTIGGSYNFGDQKQYTAAFGVMAPYTAIASYPLTVGGQPSPSRYSLVSLGRLGARPGRRVLRLQTDQADPDRHGHPGAGRQVRLEGRLQREPSRSRSSARPRIRSTTRSAS